MVSHVDRVGLLDGFAAGDERGRLLIRKKKGREFGYGWVSVTVGPVVGFFLGMRKYDRCTVWI